MDIDAFMHCIKHGKIPPSAPDGMDEHGWARPKWYDSDSHRGWTARTECTERGMWAIVDRPLAQALATYIDGRQVLEIMAGAGWLAKALSDEGVSIIATDSQEWDARHDKMARVYPVEQLEASEAIAHYPHAEVLIVSWPPYGEGAVVEAGQCWGSGRPIIYIGEGQGGCNAPDEWWDHFDHDASVQIALMSWCGMHDHVWVGYWID